MKSAHAAAAAAVWFIMFGIAGDAISEAHAAPITPIQVYGAWHCGNDYAPGRRSATWRISIARTTG